MAGVHYSFGNFVIIGCFQRGKFRQFTQTLIVMSRQSLTSLSFAETTEGAMAGIVSALDDPYSYYLNEEEFTSMMEEVSGSYKGIGVYIGEDENSPYVSILSPIKRVLPPLMQD